MNARRSNEPNAEWTAYREAGHTVEETARHFGVDPGDVSRHTPLGIRTPSKRGSSRRTLNRQVAREFGIRVRLLRESHGISQRSLCLRAGIPEPSVLARYEDGSRIPNLIDAFNLAQALGVSLDTLCRRTENG